ncbi:hypothetical protein BST37_07835 [Mycobacterium noviomagense]|uniref:Transposase n=1 Tax=Mycobacterium noviomagense TaxID=459858 RepID=A0ABX3T7F9_9MYCO|nr:hypothetical protein BST37_07835 [Mycobacterium noviomagense]
MRPRLSTVSKFLECHRTGVGAGYAFITRFSGLLQQVRQELTMTEYKNPTKPQKKQGAHAPIMEISGKRLKARARSAQNFANF